MNKYIVVIIVLLVLFLGTLSFSIFILTQGDNIYSKSLQPAQSEVSKAGPSGIDKTRLSAEEQQKLMRDKIALEKQLIAEIENRPTFNEEKDSPFDHVKDSQVKVFQHKVEISLKDVTWYTIRDTNSMDPVIDAGNTALTIKPQSEDDIRRGDVAVYDSVIAQDMIIHRVIEISSDTQGWYSKFKGDNLEYPDPEDVRFTQIKGVLVGIIY